MDIFEQALRKIEYDQKRRQNCCNNCCVINPGPTGPTGPTEEMTQTK